MNIRKVLMYIEAVFLIVGIIGSVSFYYSPASINLRDTFLDVKKGDILRLIIHSFEYDYIVSGNYTLYDFTTGIYLYPFEYESDEYETVIVTETVNNETYTYEDIIYKQFSDKTVTLFEGNQTHDLIINFEVVNKIDRDHAILKIQETGQTFLLWIRFSYGAGNAFATPYLNMGLTFYKKTDPEAKYIHWCTTPIFSSSTAREALNWHVEKVGFYNPRGDWIKKGENEYFYSEGYFGNTINPETNTSWILYPKSNRVQYMNYYVFNENSNWSQGYHNLTLEIWNDMSWYYNLTLKIEFQYLRVGGSS